MRITGGRSRGRILLGPRGRLIRPTADRVREAVFNILGQDLSGTHVLDLFSGTGSLGLEALSRGAIYAVFIDNRIEAIELIRKNVERCGRRRCSRVLMRDLEKGIPWEDDFLRTTFDLVFLDPPYARDIVPSVVAEILRGKRLSAGAKVVIETGRKTELPSSFPGLPGVHFRIYGDTKISIYELGD